MSARPIVQGPGDERDATLRGGGRAAARRRLARGPLLMLGATALFTIMVGFVKTVRAELEPFEIMVWRSLVSAPLALAFSWSVGLRVRAPGPMLARVCLGSCAMACFFTAAKGLSLADLSILSRIQPIVVALLAPLLLGRAERSGRLLWALLAVGLVGCSLIIGPELQLGSKFGLWALAATLFSAGAHVTVRRLGRSDDPRIIVFWFQVGAFFLANVAHAILHGELVSLPPVSLWPALAAIGVFATSGQLLMTLAYKLDKASRVAAASYVAPLFGLLGDVLVFGIWPGALAIAGGTLVVGAGMLLLRAPRGERVPPG